MTTNLEMKTGDYNSDSKPRFTTSNDVELEDGIDRTVGEIVETRRIQQKFGMLRKARQLEELMDRKLGVESQVRDRGMPLCGPILTMLKRALIESQTRKEALLLSGTSSSSGFL